MTQDFKFVYRGLLLSERVVIRISSSVNAAGAAIQVARCAFGTTVSYYSRRLVGEPFGGVYNLSLEANFFTNMMAKTYFFNFPNSFCHRNTSKIHPLAYKSISKLTNFATVTGIAKSYDNILGKICLNNNIFTADKSGYLGWYKYQRSSVFICGYIIGIGMYITSPVVESLP